MEHGLHRARGAGVGAPGRLVIEYPAFHAAASRGAAKAQQAFIGTTAAHLIALIVAAVLGVVPDTRAGVVSASLLVVSLFLSVVQKVSKFDDRWFVCRALAENVKSAAWHYVMDTREEAKARSNLLTELGEIRKRFPEHRAHLAGTGIEGENVTQWMRDSASMTWTEKLALYKQHRIDDQVAWYAKKSSANGRQESVWAIGILALEFVAAILALLAALLGWGISPAAPLATLAAAGVAWSQTKRFSDLATSYRVAADDLQLLRESVIGVQDEGALRGFVRDVEHAISREHSIWRARRGV